MRRAASFIATLLVVATIATAVPEITADTAAIAAAAGPIKVLILGDSYSAGTGGGSYSGPVECFRSANTWGQQLGTMISSATQRAVDVTNRACSGAVSRDFYRNRDVGETRSDVTFTSRQAAANWASEHCTTVGPSQGGPEWGDVLGAPMSPLRVGSRRGYYVGRCRLWVPPQLDNVNNTYDYVVMTLGGNDAGFSNIGAGCLADPFPSGWNKVTAFAYLSLAIGIVGARAVMSLLASQTRSKSKCLRSFDAATALVGRGDLTTRLTGVLHDVETALNVNRSGEPGKVLLLDYPNLIRNRSYNFANVSPAVGDRLYTLQQAGQAAEADAVAAADHATNDPCAPHSVVFGDATKPFFAGHELTAPVGVNAVDLPGLPDGSQPDSYLWPIKVSLSPLGITESAHPTVDGYLTMALAAFEALTANGLGRRCCPSTGNGSTVLVWNPTNAVDLDEGITMSTQLEAAGYDVALCNDALPADLSGFRAVFHLGAYRGFSESDAAQLESFVASGRGLFLTGERPCCEDLNQSVQAVVNHLLTAPPAVGGVGDQFPYDSPYTVNTALPSSLLSTPNTLTTWTPSAPGGMSNVASDNAWAYSGFGVPVGGVWGPSDMASGQGRLVVLMDVNWIQTAYLDAHTTPQVVANLAYYLAGAPTHAARRRAVVQQRTPRAHGTRRLPQDSTTGVLAD